MKNKYFVVECKGVGDAFALDQFIKHQQVTTCKSVPMDDVIEKIENDLMNGFVTLDDAEGEEVEVISLRYVDFIVRHRLRLEEEF